ncbi:MAG: hypothetical protein FWE30_03535 [Bacteroidales bacterium]|nr:hypothetical protein [Bacteroidales bacterium]
MKTLTFDQMEQVNGGINGCDYIETAAVAVGLGGLVIGWIPIANMIYAIVTSPVVIAGAMCHFWGP